MKFLGLFLLLSVNGCLSSAINNNNDEVEPYSIIRDLIEEFLKLIKEAIPEKVYLSDREIVDVETEYASAYVLRTEGVLEDLNNFDVNVQYTGILIPIPTAVTVQYSRLLSHSKYLSRFGVDFLPEGLQNDLAAKTIVTNTVFHAGIEFSLTPLSLQLRDLQLNVGGLEVVMEGILGSDILSRLVSEILTSYGADVANRYSDVLASVVTEIINDFLRRNFPIPQLENHENVDPINYSKEELDAHAQALKTGLTNVVNELRRVLN